MIRIPGDRYNSFDGLWQPFCVAIGFLNPVSYFSSEVCFKKLLIQDYLVKPAEARSGKVARHQTKGNIGILDLVSEPFYAMR